MLEMLDPVNRLRPAADVRQASEPASVDGAGCGRPAAPAAGDPAAAPWSSDWLQLSHELRTPLNAILGNIELLLDGSAGPLAAPARACVGDIQAASRQLLRQLQPLLLLVQARTAAAAVSGLPIDLLALLRQAAADAEAAPDRGATDESAARPRGAPRLPEGVRVMVTGDPVWLGALAAALLDLNAASAKPGEPLSITLERLAERPEERSGNQPACCGRGVVLRAFWRGLEGAAASPLPLALIDAVLALHDGRIRSLSADGLRLELPGARVVRSSP